MLTPQPHYKLYSVRAITIGTFFGGPLVAGYLMAENYRLLGQKEKVLTTWAIAILSILIILAAPLSTTKIDNVFRYINLTPLIISFTTRFLAEKYQGANIEEHISRGGKIYSVWRAFWIGIIGLMFLCSIAFVYILITDKDLYR